MVAETLTRKQISSNCCIVFRQGMGIYLFGELIISQQSKHRALVDEVLMEIGAEMDRCTYQTVKDMLEGKEWLEKQKKKHRKKKRKKYE